MPAAANRLRLRLPAVTHRRCAVHAVFFWWELGVLRYLHRNFDLTKVQLVGASAGGLISTLAACGVDEDKAVS